MSTNLEQILEEIDTAEIAIVKDKPDMGVVIFTRPTPKEFRAYRKAVQKLETAQAKLADDDVEGVLKLGEDTNGLVVAYAKKHAIRVEGVGDVSTVPQLFAKPSLAVHMGKRFQEEAAQLLPPLLRS